MTRVLRRLVLWYQALTATRPSPCRYWPTCSSYALEALEEHGAARGSWLTLRRLLRCDTRALFALPLLIFSTQTCGLFTGALLCRFRLRPLPRFRFNAQPLFLCGFSPGFRFSFETRCFLSLSLLFSRHTLSRILFGLQSRLFFSAESRFCCPSSLFLCTACSFLLRPVGRLF